MSYQPSDIAALREALKLSQEEFALMLGVNRSNVSRWERGETRPRGSVRKLLEHVSAKAARRSRVSNEIAA